MASWVKVLTLLCLFIAISCAQSTKEKMKMLFCSEDLEIKAQVEKCTAMMPPQAVAAKEECMKSIAPDITNEEDFRKACCDPSTGIGDQMCNCMTSKKDLLSTLPPEDMKKIVDTMECFTGMMA